MLNTKRGLIHHGICWLGFAWIHKLATFILFYIFFSSTVLTSIEKETPDAYNITVFMSILSVVLFPIITSIIIFRNRNADRRAAYTAAKEHGFDFFGYYGYYFYRILVSTEVYFATQLIYTIFYTVAGYEYTTANGQTLIEKIHFADVGSMLATGSGFGGLMLNTVIFFAVFNISMLIVLKLWTNNKN